MKYEAPAIKVVGKLGDLTQVTVKHRHHTLDGIDFQFGKHTIALSS
jgi:hypothetical protein